MAPGNLTQYLYLHREAVGEPPQYLKPYIGLSCYSSKHCPELPEFSHLPLTRMKSSLRMIFLTGPLLVAIREVVIESFEGHSARELMTVILNNGFLGLQERNTGDMQLCGDTKTETSIYGLPEL